MERVIPTSEEIVSLTGKLMKFKTFIRLRFLTTEYHNPKDFKRNYSAIDFDLNILVQDESECNEIKKVINEHFIHTQKVGFCKEFFIPGKGDRWKKSSIGYF